MKTLNLKEVEVSMAKRSWRESVMLLRRNELNIMKLNVFKNKWTDAEISRASKRLKNKRKRLIALVTYWKNKYKFYQRKVNVKDEF